MDGVSHQDLGFAVGIADADMNGLGVGIAILRGYSFVVDFAVQFVFG